MPDPGEVDLERVHDAVFSLSCLTDPPREGAGPWLPVVQISQRVPRPEVCWECLVMWAHVGLMEIDAERARVRLRAAAPRTPVGAAVLPTAGG